MSARAQIVPVFVPHLGCPYACVYCDQRRISGQHASVSPQLVERAVQNAAALPRTGAERQIAFYGGSFTAIPEREQLALLAPAKAAVDRGVVDSIRLSTRPDAIDEEVLTRLRAYGVKTIELGAQSMDDEVLRLSGRGHSSEDVVRASGLIRDAGFQLVLQMMTGLPGDTDERDLETARAIVRIRPDAVRIYPTVVVRGTGLYRMWRAGLYREHTVEDAVRVCARILPLFREAGIPAIRLGLDSTEELSGGEAVAGAYHPALGELVRSRIMRERARDLLAGVTPGSDVVLGIHRSRLSQMIGQKRANVGALCRDLDLRSLRVVPLDGEQDEIRILYCKGPIPSD